MVTVTRRRILHALDGAQGYKSGSPTDRSGCQSEITRSSKTLIPRRHPLAGHPGSWQDVM